MASSLLARSPGKISRQKSRDFFSSVGGQVSTSDNTIVGHMGVRNKQTLFNTFVWKHIPYIPYLWNVQDEIMQQ
jgi:hypothetical protein